MRVVVTNVRRRRRRRRVGRGAGSRSRSRRCRCCLVVVVVINAVVLVVGVLDVARRRCCCCCYAAGVMAEVRGRSHEGMSRPCKRILLLSRPSSSTSLAVLLVVSTNPLSHTQTHKTQSHDTMICYTRRHDDTKAERTSTHVKHANEKLELSARNNVEITSELNKK